jgi:hypothetical protein
MVEEAFSSPELVSLSGKHAWRALPREMAKFGIILAMKEYDNPVALSQVRT